ncbi:MAG TPA: hypothetical protein VK593_08900 [Edaphobacter sp.]|nr:hypothetical protein [Edaphobacter sp.]
MQALCKASDHSPDVTCPICGKGFHIYWERTSRTQQDAALPAIQLALREHHDHPETATHPSLPFTVPSWSGLPQFSAAALLGGATL